MQLPFSWIKELVDFDWSPEELARKLTSSGAEAEIAQPFAGKFNNIVVGRIVEIEPIEGTDHLKRAVVDTGDEKLQVVCGAPNAAPDQKIVFAKIGSELEGGFKIKKVKLRGVESNGMICSEKELGISDDHRGIIILENDAPLGAPADKYLGLDDHAVLFDLTPNRMDMLCAIGVARDIACLTGHKVKRPEFELTECDEKANEYIKISIEDADACPRYAARMIKNVKIGPSPWWIKQKLILSGIRPISNIVDITNLVMMEFGHPMHAFDYNNIKSKEIVVRRAREGEKFITLDGQEHDLTPEVLLITDGERGIAAGGIMGGLDSEVTPETTDILLEAAYFNASTVRRGRILLGIKSESSHRFERGMDPNIIPRALDRATYLMNKYGGGDVLSGIVDCYPQTIEPKEIEFRPERANALLGTDISKERMINILIGLEMNVIDEGTLKVTVPTWQPEITREVDLIEEIVRIEGYESIVPNDKSNGPLFTPERPDDLFRADIRRVMTAQGYDEIFSSGLADSNLLAKLSNNDAQLRILNPISEDINVLQNDVNYSLLKAVSYNIAQRNINLTLFEICRAFYPGNPPDEKEYIGVTISGGTENNWYSSGARFNFYYLKGVLDSLLDGCNIPPVGYSEVDAFVYEEESSFILKIGDETVGRAGLIKPEIARLFDIKQPVQTAVLDFDLLLQLRLPLKSYKPLPKFPAAPRDLAVIIDDTVNVGDIQSEIYKTGGELLKEIEIFDVYRGKQVPDGKKSIAFSMIYRSDERSLRNEEVVEIQDRIAKHLKERFNAEIREG